MDSHPPRPSTTQAALIMRQRRGRNLAMLLVLLGLAVLFFAITLVKMSAHP